MDVSLKWISNTNTNPVQITNSARAVNGTKRARAVNGAKWPRAVNSTNYPRTVHGAKSRGQQIAQTESGQ